MTEFSIGAVLFQADCKMRLMPVEGLGFEKQEQHKLAKQYKTSTVSTADLEHSTGVFRMLSVSISGSLS